MKNGTRGADRVYDQLIASSIMQEEVRAAGRFFIEHWREGKLIEEFTSPNLIVNTGLVYVSAVSFLDGTKIGAWRLALVSGTPTIVAGDTYASHGGWTEVTAYDEGSRPVWTGAAGAAGIVTNSADRAEFTISSGGATVGGVALVGGGSAPQTKGDTAGGGTLFSASAFSGGNRSLSESDILRVTWQHTYANA